MHIRITSRIDGMGRRFYVEEERRFLIFRRWVNVGSIMGYATESDAKDFAEEYAHGDWVIDSARFG